MPKKRDRVRDLDLGEPYLAAVANKEGIEIEAAYSGLRFSYDASWDQVRAGAAGVAGTLKSGRSRQGDAPLLESAEDEESSEEEAPSDLDDEEGPRLKAVR